MLFMGAEFAIIELYVITGNHRNKSIPVCLYKLYVVHVKCISFIVYSFYFDFFRTRTVHDIVKDGDGSKSCSF